MTILSRNAGYHTRGTAAKGSFGEGNRSGGSPQSPSSQAFTTPECSATQFFARLEECFFLRTISKSLSPTMSKGRSSNLTNSYAAWMIAQINNIVPRSGTWSADRSRVCRRSPATPALLTEARRQTPVTAPARKAPLIGSVCNKAHHCSTCRQKDEL